MYILFSFKKIEVHPHNVREDLIKYCDKVGVHVTGYSIFGSNQAGMVKLPEVLALADKYKKTAGQIIVRWCIDSSISCVPKSRDPKRLLENLTVGDFSLTAEDIQLLNKLDKGFTVFDRNELWGFNPFA